MQSNQKLVENIKKGWSFYDESEAHSYNAEVLIAFAEAGQNFIHRIPKELLSESVLKSVAKNDKTNQCLKYISADDVIDYREIAVSAISSSYGNTRHVNDNYVDTNFIKEVAHKNPAALCAFLELYHDLTHQALDIATFEDFVFHENANINQVVGGYLRNSFSTKLITDDFIKRSALKSPSLIYPLLHSTKKQIAFDLINNSEWPEAIINDKPTDLKDAVKRMMKPLSSTVQTWQIAYAMTFGIEEVVRAMKSPSRIELLESIYTRAEILPHLNQRKDLKAKGRWLEEDLGM